MRLLIDIFMIVITTAIMLRSFTLVVKYRSKSIADYCILLLYIFQCLPVVCDIIIGIPKYPDYLIKFKYALENDLVSVIYDVYIIFIFIAMFIVSNNSLYKYELNNLQPDNFIYEKISSTSNLLLCLLIILPLIHVLFSGYYVPFLIYASPSVRGLPTNFTELSSNFLIISIIALTIWYFKSKPTPIRILVFVMFSFIDIWISGKRYIIITILFSYIYMYSIVRGNSNKKKNLKLWIVITIAAIILFSVYYLVIIRKTTNNIYTDLRIDFGRDDVVKFSIMKELINGEHILDYPGETIISTILMIVPRTIFSAKPYPHYRYLTSAIYSVPLLDVPSGMTPSILEMMVSNFQWLGIPICIIFLCWYCGVVDREKSSAKKYIYAVVLMGLLSQSMDAMMPIFYLALFFIFTRRIRFTFKYKRGN